MIPKITHSELPFFINLAIKTRKNLLIVGKPGLGKTVGVLDYAKREDFNVEISHPAVEDPTNITGFPAKATRTVTEEPDELDMMLGTGETKTYQEDYATFLRFGQQDRLLKARKNTIWFIDDFGQAPNAMQAGMMQFLGSRELNGAKLPECVHIIAATNGRDDKAGVKGLLEPVKSRFAIIVELVADLPSFRDYWYSKGLPYMIVDFLNATPHALHDWNPNLGMENSPCPRLWEHLGGLLLCLAPDINTDGLPDTINKTLFAKLCNSVIGEKYGASFAAFCVIYSQIPRYSAIIADPENFEVNHTLPIRFAIMGILAQQGKLEHSAAVFQVVEKFAKEYQTIFMQTISAMKSPLLKSKEAMLWTGKNAEIFLSAQTMASTAF